MEFKVGDKVRIIDKRTHGFSIGDVVTVSRVLPRSITVNSAGLEQSVLLDEVTKVKDINDLSTLEVGDVVVSGGGEERMILALCGRMVALSCDGDFDALGHWETDKELAGDFKLKEEQTESIEIEGKKYTATEIKEALKKAGK